MCGRYGGIPNNDFKTWGLNAPVGYRQSYNIAPGTYQPVLLKKSPLHAELMKWGLIPFWSKEPRVKFSTINARSETINTSPAFRDAFHKRRCLVPTMGFYEWQRHEDGSKQPYFIHLKSRPVFAFAGIWDSWKDAEGKEIKTYSIVTCEPNEVMTPIHNRMPVILPKEVEEAWTNLLTPLHALLMLLKPYDASNMTAYTISPRVNSPMYDDKSIIDPM